MAKNRKTHAAVIEITVALIQANSDHLCNLGQMGDKDWETFKVRLSELVDLLNEKFPAPSRSSASENER